MPKPLRSLSAIRKAPVGKAVSLYKIDSSVIWASDSRANFLDVLSVGPVTSIDEIFVNDVNTTVVEEFPDSIFHTHTGSTQDTPWLGNFPYVERTTVLAKQADVLDKHEETKTEFTRSVSGLGVSGIRINFTTGGFTQRDKENRRKEATAYFQISLLDETGNIVRRVSTGNSSKYFASNATSVPLTLIVPTGYEDTIWSYKVEMFILGHRYGVSVAGNWTASTVTELYKDTQTYQDIAYCSGSIIASEVGSRTPKRQYLVDGYQVVVPTFEKIVGQEVFTGNFTRETSDSYAWNSMAVLTDDKWGAALPLDKINMLSFLEYDRYCSELINGEKRYSHSQYLIKADNYFKLAQQMVGTADGKLFEDSTGRIGVLIDYKADNRRVITTYDVVDEKVKRTTVPDTKKLNFVEGEFDDKTNNYSKTILNEQDSEAINQYGIVSKKIKLDGTTNPNEVTRILKKVLVTSQVASTSYVFEVGYSHEDVQIGEVIELYDRVHSRANYCGKIGEGSTLSVIQVDKRTPIDLSMFTNPQLVLDNSRGVPTRVDIQSWTKYSITLASDLSEIPNEFVSFGVIGDNLSPTLLRVTDVNDKKGKIEIQGISYNHSLYDHVDFGTPLLIPETQYLPPSTNTTLTGLNVVRDSNGLTATWDQLIGWSYNFYWKRFGENDPDSGKTIASGTLTDVENTTSLLFPLESSNYTLYIYAVNDDQTTPVVTESYNLNVDESGSSTLPPITNLGVKSETGTIVQDYVGRSFTIKWKYPTDTGQPVETGGFILNVSQLGQSLEKSVKPEIRELFISEAELVSTFGEDYQRTFEISARVFDGNLQTTSTILESVTNEAPDPPIVIIDESGSFTLTYSGSIPSDVTNTKTYIWPSNDPNEVPPPDATILESTDLEDITIPDETIVFDGSNYNYNVAYIDTFGEVGSQYGKAVLNTDSEAPEPVPPELLTVVPVSETEVTINFEHEGDWLRLIKVFYRKYGETLWIEYGTIFDILSSGVEWGYNQSTEQGFFNVNGLDFNREYEFKCQAANLQSPYSEDSNIVIGMALISRDLGIDLTEKINEFEENGLVLEDTVISLRKSEKDINSLAEEVFNVTNSYAGFIQDYERRTLEGETLTNAVVRRDPETGQIVNLAYQYTDQSFTQAGILIDGVNGRIDATVERIAYTDNRVTQAESELEILAGSIELRATYSEVNQIVDGAIAALEPAYSWQFNTGTDGWTGVTHTGVGTVQATNGVPVEITGISFDADDNPMFRINIKKGSNWQGTLSWNGGSQNIQIMEPATNDFEVVNLELTAADGWTGTITSLSLQLGDSEINSIVVGKRDSADQAIDGLTSRITTAELDIDAVENQISLKLDTQTWNNQRYTDSDVQIVLDGWDTSIGLTTTLTELNDEGTITKANNADLWINSAESNIEAVVTAFNAQPNGVDDQIEGLGDQINSVGLELDAVENTVTTNASSIAGFELDLQDTDGVAFDLAYKNFLTENDRAVEGVKLSYAEETIQSLTTENESLAQRTLDLEAVSEQAKSDIKSVQKAVVNDVQSTASEFTQLRAEMDTADGEVIAEANEYTRASIGYCVDGQGNVTSEENAVACVAAGNSWIQAPLAEAVRQVQITTASGDKASVGQQMLVLENTSDSTIQALNTVTADLETTDIKAGSALTIAAEARDDNITQGQAIATLETTVEDPITGLSVTNQIAQIAEQTADDNAQAITSITSSIDDPNTGLSANAGAIASVEQRAEVLESQAYLFADVNGRISGVKASSDGILTDLEFIGDLISFVDSSGDEQLSYNNSTDLWTFSGDLSAASGTFSGTIFTQVTENVVPVYAIATASNTSFSAGLFNHQGSGSGKRGVEGRCFNGDGVHGYGSTTGGSGVYGTGDKGVHGHGQDIGVYGTVAPVGATSDFYAGTTGTYLPFTGSHEGLVLKGFNYTVGDIVIDDGIFNINDVSNAISFMNLSTKPMQKSAVGAVVTVQKLKPHRPPIGVGDDSLFIGITHDVVIFNGVGEGAINVCGENGDIEIGDLIVTSSMKGKGMKQSDDLVRNYTVAKSRQNVTFETPDEVKQIAVIYMGA